MVLHSMPSSQSSSSTACWQLEIAGRSTGRGLAPAFPKACWAVHHQALTAAPGRPAHLKDNEVAPACADS